jgi:hypothetical protein
MADDRSVTMPIDELEKIERRAAKAGELAKKGTEWGMLQVGKHKGILMAAIAGAVGWFVVSNKAWSDNIGFLKNNWWAKPLGLLAIGWLLYWKKSQYAQAVIFLGAALFVTAYRNYRFASNPANKAAVDAFAASGMETGMPYEFEAGGTWTKDAAGNDRFEAGAKPAAYADRVFENARAS